MTSKAGRCSSCHCFSRNCPVGLPNHKDVNPVGPQCTMNGLGRHYRDQTDTGNPTCDYEHNGVKCSFFSTDELAKLPYPDDVTLGPLSEPPPPPTTQVGLSELSPPPTTQGGDLSAILALLQQQKAESEKTNEQMRQLQGQVNSLITRVPNNSSQSNPAPTRNSPLTGNSAPNPVLHPAPPQIFSVSTTTAPTVVASAAAGLTAALQAGLGHTNNYGYTGLTMDQLRSDPAIVSQAAAMLSSATHNVPPLNPQYGLGTVQNDQVISSVDQLYAATTVNKQLRAFEFASTGQFPYKNQLKQDNCNAVCFAYGAFKHLEAAKSGLIKNMSESEFLARLKHLKNVFEIACLSSTLTSFSDPSWQIAREYDARVTADIESGIKSWDTLSSGLETDSIYCAKETVELKNRAKKPPKDPKDRLKRNDDEKLKKADPRKNGCTTFNTHRASDGCYWEHTNKGETCVFEHFCSWCKVNRDVKEKHKILNCEYKTE